MVVARNCLGDASSPYLLQHAANPVHWHEWGDEAFERAALEDKLIFLSIGYSTCHWCHVMAHESFEDAEVASALNRAFVSIKVDREERPDVDGVYMAACQLLTGGGGWPLTLLLTPDRRPVFAATYLPKGTGAGGLGLLDLLERASTAWRDDRGRLVGAADAITGALRDSARPAAPEPLDARSVLEDGYRQLEARYDERNGGFGDAPKFPAPHQISFLLRWWKRTGEPRALQMAVDTLRAMRRGGLWDHVGFGFHRYSTDARWLVPHFEKMLYDQALLALAYLDGYEATGDEDLASTARDVFTYLLRDLRDPEGGFHAAEDADSAEGEGAFYLWCAEEVERAVGPELAPLALGAFGVAPGTACVLHRSEPDGELVPAARLEEVRGRLASARAARERPGRDDKVLADWNGLAIAALARGARVLREPTYAEAAEGAARFVLERLRDGRGRLLHRWRRGVAGLAATLDDYADVAWGLLELHDATLEPRWLREAQALTETALADFGDDASGGLFFTAAGAEELLVRRSETYDGAHPSGASVMAGNLVHLARKVGEGALGERAQGLFRASARALADLPSAHAHMLCALDSSLGS